MSVTEMGHLAGKTMYVCTFERKKKKKQHREEIVAAANVIELYERIISCLKYIYLQLECVNIEITTN